MIELAYMPVVIEAHRNDLRKLYHPAPSGAQHRSPRERLGTGIIRFGRWLDNRRGEVAMETSGAASSQRSGPGLADLRQECC